MELHVELTFLNKPARKHICIDAEDHISGLMQAITCLNDEEQKEVLGLRICYIGREV